MHPSAFRNGNRFVRKYLTEKKQLDVLDVGSFDFNGRLRSLFEVPGWTYIGLDREGKPKENVNNHILKDGAFPFDDGSFDVIVSTSCLEHDRAFWLTFAEMIRVARDGALIYLNVPSKGPYHPFPQDCWHFMDDAFDALSASFFQVELIENYITEEEQWNDNVGIFMVDHHSPAAKDVYDEGFFDDIHQKSLESAKVVLGSLFERIHPERIVDVGCGSGAWLSAARELGAKEVLGLDGAWAENKYVLESNTFIPVDLEWPIPLDGSFDLVISMEVAEHLSARRARSFIGDLVRLGDVILFSAAVPLQEGCNHLNEQWPDYWASLFKEYGYQTLDIIRPVIWGNNRVEWWYQQNTLIFCKDNIFSDRFPGVTAAEVLQLRRVHESPYLKILDYPKRIARMSHQLEGAKADSARLRVRLDEAELKNEALLKSTCWKATYPVRKLKDFFRLPGKG